MSVSICLKQIQLEYRGLTYHTPPVCKLTALVYQQVSDLMFSENDVNRSCVSLRCANVRQTCKAVKH